MVKIRLRRVGTKKKPSYRLVVADSRAPRDGAFINIVGHYDPLTEPETVVIDEEYKFGHITYLKEKEEVDIGEDEIEAIKIFARAEFEGIAGMNGDAWGWFSPGDYVPLMGKIRILLGSITIKMDDSNNE